MKSCFVIFSVLTFTSAALANIDLDPKSNNDVRNYYKKTERKGNNTSSAVCDDCKLVASELKNVIDDQTKLDRIKVALRFMCEYIGGEKAEECKRVVDNLDFIIHQLQPYLDNPEQFCREIHLCGQHKIKPSSRILIHLMKVSIRASERDDASDTLCDECVFAATELNSLLQSPQVQQVLRKQLESLCTLCPQGEKCNSAIEANFPKLMAFLETLLNNPREFCARVHFCASPRMSLRNFRRNPPRIRRIENAMASASLLQTKSGNNVVCTVCMTEVEAAKHAMERKEDIVANKISLVICGMLPRDLQAGCSDFSSIYAVALLNMTIQQFDAKEVCQDAGLCSALDSTNFQQLEGLKKSITECEACRTFTDFLSFEFHQQPLQHEISAMIKEYVCKNLPGDLENQCLDTADQYVPTILQRLADTLSSASFCIELGMCAN